MSKRSTLHPAWAEHTERNMRGESVSWAGTTWLVITHIRGGLWKAGRVSGSWDHGDYITLKLNPDGTVAADKQEKADI